MFVLYCVVSNSCTVGYVCSFCRDQIFMHFVNSLSMVIYEVLYRYTLSWCLKYNICSAWFSDTRISTYSFSSVISLITGSINLKWDVLWVMYLPFQRAVIIVPLLLVTQKGDGSKCVESLFCFLWCTNTKSPTLILDGLALTCVSAQTFILGFASSSFLLTSWLFIWLLSVSCGSLFRTFLLNSNCAGVNPVMQCVVDR